jgi:hypothetical protein
VRQAGRRHRVSRTEASFVFWSWAQLLKAVLALCRRRRRMMWLRRVRDMVCGGQECRMLTIGVLVGRIANLLGSILGLDLISGTLGTLRRCDSCYVCHCCRWLMAFTTKEWSVSAHRLPTGISRENAGRAARESRSFRVDVIGGAQRVFVSL